LAAKEQREPAQKMKFLRELRIQANSRIFLAILWRPKTWSAAPSLTASRCIPKTLLVASSWAMVAAPLPAFPDASPVDR